jgi:hypothetical protein
VGLIQLALIHAGSHVPSVEHKDVHTTRRETLNVGHGCLSFGASERALDGGEIVKV